MKKFLIKILLFFIPLMIISAVIELSISNNTFKAKANIIEKDKQNIELLILGSSQNWRAINPKYLSIKTAPLAHGESAINIDFLLFDRFLPKLPNLKIVIFELSYHSLDDSRGNDWNKNHLFYNYYRINNYQNIIPFEDRLLLTSNFKEYFKIFFTSSTNQKFGRFNEYGFINETLQTRFEKYNYDSTLISKSSMNEYLEGRHQKENIHFFNDNIIKLDIAIKKCLENNIKVVLLSPPKYYLYNEIMNQNKLDRRNMIFEKYRSQRNVYIWNYETEYEYQTKLFGNEDHLNPKGAKVFTRKIDNMLNKLINEKR